MEEKQKFGSKDIEESIISLLLEDPTKSINEMAKELKSYRQTIWRRKKKLEDDKVIWGYTAVIDEDKRDKILYLVLLKMKPMTPGLADTIIKRMVGKDSKKRNIRLIDAFHVNGEYDWIIRFSAPDHATASSYFDALRLIFEDYLLEKPVIVDVSFILIAEGKSNPDVNKLYDFVPTI